jgi:hypothetical protein
MSRDAPVHGSGSRTDGQLQGPCERYEQRADSKVPLRFRASSVGLIPRSAPETRMAREESNLRTRIRSPG